jgi:hypothetical protein
MNSLTELNGYVQDLSFTYTDLRLATVIFDRVTPTGQSLSVDKGFTFLSIPGIEIVEIVNSSQTNVTYTIDVSTLADTTVAWDTVPSGCTVTNPSSGVYIIDGITAKSIWDTVKAARITCPNNYFGVFGFVSTITYYDGYGSGYQTKSFINTITVNDVQFLTTPLEFSYPISATTLITNTPSLINLDTAYPGVTWTVVITPSSTSPISNFTNSGTGGTFSVDGSTKVITIVGTRTQVNSRLAGISLVSNANIIDISLSYFVTNSLNAITDTKVQVLKNLELSVLGVVTTSPVYYIEESGGLVAGAPLIVDSGFDGSGTYTYKVKPSVLGSTDSIALATKVTSVSLAANSGYARTPTVTFSAPEVIGGVTATGTATVASGIVTGIVITNAGSGYLATPTVTIASPLAVAAWTAGGSAIVGRYYSYVSGTTTNNYLATASGTFSSTPPTFESGDGASEIYGVALTYSAPPITTSTAWTAGGTATANNYYSYLNGSVTNYYLATTSGTFSSTAPTFQSATGDTATYGVELTYTATLAKGTVSVFDVTTNVSYNNSIKTLTLTGTKSQINDRLFGLSINTSVDYADNFSLIYELVTPRSTAATKVQLLVCGSNDTEVTNMNITRSYVSNTASSIFSTNIPFISDFDEDPLAQYTISFSNAPGTFAFVLSQSPLITTADSANISFTGTRTECNNKFANLRFYSNLNISSNTTFTYRQLKNGVQQVLQNIGLNGSAGSYTGGRTIYFASSQSWSPNIEDFRYGKISTIIMGGGGGGGGGGGLITGTWQSGGSVITKKAPGGGGGSGGVRRSTTSILLTPNTAYTISLGTGGLGGASFQTGGNGGTTSAFGLSIGGGFGGNATTYIQNTSTTVISSITPARGGYSGPSIGAFRQDHNGNAGGDGFGILTSGFINGGGGGAHYSIISGTTRTGVGSPANSGAGGRGAFGFEGTISSASTVFYAAGGGGGGQSGGLGGATTGYSGGSGASNLTPSTPGPIWDITGFVHGLGHGGGGGYGSYNGSKGSDGFVVITIAAQ